MENGKNPMWEAYQKEIANNHYYFARSFCQFWFGL